MKESPAHPQKVKKLNNLWFHCQTKTVVVIVCHWYVSEAEARCSSTTPSRSFLCLDSGCRGHAWSGRLHCILVRYNPYNIYITLQYFQKRRKNDMVVPENPGAIIVWIIIAGFMVGVAMVIIFGSGTSYYCSHWLPLTTLRSWKLLHTLGTSYKLSQWNYCTPQDMIDQCTMLINVDQCAIKSLTLIQNVSQ